MAVRLASIAMAIILGGVSSLALAGATPSESESIVVLGDRAEQAGLAADQALAITMRPGVDYPLPRRYGPICVKVFGIAPAFGNLVAERIGGNAKALGLAVAKPGCEPNLWIGFFRDSKKQVQQLRKKDPAFFATLDRLDIKRIFKGSDAVQVWHASEIRSVDGRPIPIIELEVAGRKIETAYNPQYSGTRLASPIRNDINATILVFDRDQANGKTVQQLADYATFRALAPVQDFAQVAPDAVPSILMLFTPGAVPPDGLTEFDWAYLSAFYKLDRGAKASAVHDATRRAMLDGAGQKLREKAAAD
ncbi:MAG: hypothetical protein ACK4YM_00505 [Novosphingobium sp.]